jgi:hypothetical protein
MALIGNSGLSGDCGPVLLKPAIRVRGGAPAYEDDRMPSRDQRSGFARAAPSDVLSDPVVMAVMRADRVNPDELARILRIPVCDRSFGGAGEPAKDRLSG